MARGVIQPDEDFFFREGMIAPAATPASLLRDLIAQVESYSLARGIQNSFVVQLQAALAAVEAGDAATARARLDDFIHHTRAQSGKKLTPEQAAEMIASAQAILDRIG